MAGLQDHIDTIELYRQGCHPGSCTTAILEGDLFAAVIRADLTTQYLMSDIALYILMHMPPESYGSKAKVAAWFNGGWLEYATAHTEVVKQPAKRGE